MAPRDKKKRDDWEEDAFSIPVPMQSVNAGLRPVDENGNVKDKTETSAKSKTQKIKSLLSERTEKLATAKGIMEVHPDLRLAKEILTAQILSPKDLSDYRFRLAVNKVLYDKKVKPEALEKIVALFNKHHKFEKKAPEWLGHILFDHGAVVHLILPPAKIDKLVENSVGMDLESFDNTAADVLYPDYEYHAAKNDDLSRVGIDGIHDNYHAFYRQETRKRLLEKKQQNGYDFESMSFSVDHRTAKDEGMITIDAIKEEDRNANALVLRISPDIVLPVCDPSDPSVKHGYYILADENGHLSSSCQETGFMKDLLNRLKKALHDESSQEYTVIKDLGFIENDKEKKSRQTMTDLMSRWVDEVEKPIREQIKKSGLISGDVDLKEYENFYRILLSRHLKKKKTRIIYVPAKLVSYMALEYNEIGQGVSLLEQTAYYSSVRAIVQITGLMNMMHNAIPTTDLSITLDEDDDDPMGTIETVMHELSKMTALNFPIGTVDPSEIITSLQKAAYRIKVDGGTKFPTTSAEMSDGQKSRTTQINSEVDEDLRRKQYAGLGVSPEAIDQSLQGEFATQLVLNDLMSARRAMTKQAILKDCYLEFIQKVIEFSPAIIKEIKDAGVDDVARFVYSLELVMPTADTSRIEQHAESWDKLNRFVDEVFPSIISDDMLRGIAGVDSQYTRDMLDDMRNMFASGLKRMWLKDNNILPEIWAIIDPDDETGMAAEIKDHYERVFKSVGPMIKSVLKGISKNDIMVAKELERLKNAAGEDEDATPGDAPAPGIAAPFDSQGNAFGEEGTDTGEVPDDPFAAGDEQPEPQPFEDDLGEGGEEEQPPVEGDAPQEEETPEDDPDDPLDNDPFAEEQEENLDDLEEEQPEEEEPQEGEEETETPEDVGVTDDDLADNPDDPLDDDPFAGGDDEDEGGVIPVPGSDQT